MSFTFVTELTFGPAFSGVLTDDGQNYRTIQLLDTGAPAGFAPVSSKDLTENLIIVTTTNANGNLVSVITGIS